MWPWYGKTILLTIDFITLVKLKFERAPYILSETARTPNPTYPVYNVITIGIRYVYNLYPLPNMSSGRKLTILTLDMNHSIYNVIDLFHTTH
jgi:hypothetical protein